MKLPYIPLTFNSLGGSETEYTPGKNDGIKPRCVNPIHRQPAGWCPTCDREWDHTDGLTEEQIAEAWNVELSEARRELLQAEAKLRKLLAADPRDVVAVVEARKVRNGWREKIEHWEQW